MALQQVIASAGADRVINENFQSVEPAALYARRPGAGDLTLRYYGGRFSGVLVPDGDIALTASTAALYVVASRADGVVTVSTGTVDWANTVDFLRVGVATTGTSTITNWVDHREAFAAAGGGSTGTAWGGITGDLEDQADLQAALDDKADAAAVTTALAGKQPLAANLTQLAALVDPNADRLLFWDDSAGAFTFLTLGTNLSITGTTINAAGGGGGTDRSTVTALSIASGVVNIDCSLGDYFTLALTANVTSITFSNLPGSGKGASLMVRITQDTTPRTVTWPASFRWEGTAPSVSTGSGAVDLLAISTLDNGTKWDATLSKGRV